MDTSSEQKKHQHQQQQKTGLKRKHVVLTISNKLKVIEKIEKGVSGTLISQMFGISRQTVSDIKKHAPTIKAYASQFDVTNDKSTVSKRMTLKRSKHDRLEAALYAWYMRQRRNDVNVLKSDLLAAGETLKQQLGITELSCNTVWLNRFRIRHNIRDSDIGITEPDLGEHEHHQQKQQHRPLKSDNSSSLNDNDGSEGREEGDDESSAIMQCNEFIVKEEGETEWDYVPSEEEHIGETKTTTRENSVLDAAREGIDAVINYVGYTSNRQLWSHYEQLRSVRELIIEEQKKMHGNSLQGVEAQFNFPYT